MTIRALPPDLAVEFELFRRKGRVAIVRREFVPAFDTLGLFEAAGPPGRTPAGRAPPPAGGRGDAWIAPAVGSGEAVIRPGRRGGWIGRVIRSRYFTGDRFLDELVLTERLRRRGAPVPEPLAAVRRDRRVGYETWLATRRIVGVEPAADVLSAVGARLSATDAPLSAADPRLSGALRIMGRAVRALHEAGGDHADLNAWNVLISGDAPDDPRAYVVDLDRGRLWPAALPRHRARANLGRLRRSFEKLGLTGALDAWPEFERGYASPAEADPPAAADPPGPADPPAEADPPALPSAPNAS